MPLIFLFIHLFIYFISNGTTSSQITMHHNAIQSHSNLKDSFKIKSGIALEIYPILTYKSIFVFYTHLFFLKIKPIYFYKLMKFQYICKI